MEIEDNVNVIMDGQEMLVVTVVILIVKSVTKIMPINVQTVMDIRKETHANYVSQIGILLETVQQSVLMDPTMMTKDLVHVIKDGRALLVTHVAIQNVKFVTKIIQTNALNAMETRLAIRVNFVKKIGMLLEIALWNVSMETM